MLKKRTVGLSISSDVSGLRPRGARSTNSLGSAAPNSTRSIFNVLLSNHICSMRSGRGHSAIACRRTFTPNGLEYSPPGAINCGLK